MAPGHLLPMVDMAKLFARRNVTVSIVTTPLNSIQFRDTIDREIQSGSPIQILHVPFPNAESGIPEGCESADTLPSVDLFENFFVALRLLHQPLEELLENLTPMPSCIIADKHVMCVADIAKKLNVPRITFDGTSCFTHLCNRNLHEAFPDEDKFLVPGLPHRVELRKCQLPPEFLKTNTKIDTYRKEVRVVAEKTHMVVVNSFEELEAEYVKEYQRVTGNRLQDNFFFFVLIVPIKVLYFYVCACVYAIVSHNIKFLNLSQVGKFGVLVRYHYPTRMNWTKLKEE